MTKFKRKISAILLTLAMVFTMMPSMALTAFAEESNAIDVYVNGKSTGAGVTRTWMEENSGSAQVFPFASGQGKTWGYVVAKGPSYEAVLQETLGIKDLEEIKNATLVWRDKNGVPMGKQGALNTTKVSDLMSAVDQFKLVNDDGDIEAGTPFNSSTSDVRAVAVSNSKKITPIIAIKADHDYSYEGAVNAAAGTDWESNDELNGSHREYVGGNLSKETVLKDKDRVNIESVNFTGRFSIDKGAQINVELPLPTEPEKNSLTMKLGSGAQTLKSKYSATELDYLCKEVGDNAFITWVNENPAVVDELDSEPGTNVIKPKAAGKTKITLGINENDTAEQPAVIIAEWNVTVESNAPAVKPAPAKPTSLKVKNVKKKTAKLSWGAAANAEGYEVYRSTKKKKGFKKVAVVSGNSYKNKKLKKGKTYYFKVRSFNTVNGKKVYSGYSAVKKVKIKK